MPHVISSTVCAVPRCMFTAGAWLWLCGVSGLLASSAAAGGWSTLAPLPQARQEVAVAALDGKVYVVGGFTGSGEVADTVEVYDPASHRWDTVAPLPRPVHHTAALAVQGVLYVIGGLTGRSFTPVDTVFAYDPRHNAWTPKAAMPVARGALAAAVLADKIYVAGGSPGARERDFAVYDPATDAWTTLPPMPTSRNHLTAGAIGGIFYAVGGRSGEIHDATNAVEAFDPATNAWTTKAALPTARSGIAGVAVSGCFYVFGGEGNPAHPQGVFAQVEVYQPRTNTWQSLTPMPTPRHGIGAAALGRRIYIPGGGPVQGFGVTNVHEVFDTDIAC